MNAVISDAHAFLLYISTIVISFLGLIVIYLLAAVEQFVEALLQAIGCVNNKRDKDKLG